MISNSGPTNDKKCENSLNLSSMTPYFSHTHTYICSLHVPSSTLTTLASLTSCLSFFTFFCFNHIVSKSAEMWDNTLIPIRWLGRKDLPWPVCLFVVCFLWRGGVWWVGRGLGLWGRGLVWSVGTAKGGKFGTDCYLALPGWLWEPSTHQPQRASRVYELNLQTMKTNKTHTKKKERNTSVITVTGASWVPTPNPLFLLFFRFLYFLSLLLFVFLLCFSPSERTHWSVFFCFSSFVLSQLPSSRSCSLLFLCPTSLTRAIISVQLTFPFHMTVRSVLLLFVYILIILIIS